MRRRDSNYRPQLRTVRQTRTRFLQFLKIRSPVRNRAGRIARATAEGFSRALTISHVLFRGVSWQTIRNNRGQQAFVLTCRSIEIRIPVYLRLDSCRTPSYTLPSTTSLYSPLASLLYIATGLLRISAFIGALGILLHRSIFNQFFSKITKSTTTFHPRFERPFRGLIQPNFIISTIRWNYQIGHPIRPLITNKTAEGSVDNDNNLSFISSPRVSPLRTPCGEDKNNWRDSVKSETAWILAYSTWYGAAPYGSRKMKMDDVRGWKK